MMSPGMYPLVYGGAQDFAVATAGTYVGDWLTGLDGMLSLSAQIRLSYGSGGTAIRAFLQTSLDGGTTPIDIACKLFTTVGGVAVFNFSGLTPKLAAVVPADGGLADDTALDGILGDRLRLKLITTGTYVNSVLSGRVVAR